MSVDSKDVHFSRRQFTQLIGSATALTFAGGITGAAGAAPVAADLSLSVRVRSGGFAYRVEAACPSGGRAAISSVQIFAPALPRPELARLVLRNGQSALSHDGDVPAGQGDSIVAIATLADGSHIVRRAPIVPAI